MESRDRILGQLRSVSLAESALPAVPDFSATWPADWNRFAANLTGMGGRMAAGDTTDLSQWITATFPDAKITFSATPEYAATLTPDMIKKNNELGIVDVTVARAIVGVAETGSVLLTENELGVNTSGFLAQHIVILLDPADVLGNLHQLYNRPELHTARYAVLMTGPSATADIEGTLVLGAQGVRSLTVVKRKRPGNSD